MTRFWAQFAPLSPPASSGGLAEKLGIPRDRSRALPVASGPRDASLRPELGGRRNRPRRFAPAAR